MVEDLSVKDLSIFLSDSIPGLGKLLAEDLSLLLLSEIGEEVDLVVQGELLEHVIGLDLVSCHDVLSFFISHLQCHVVPDLIERLLPILRRLLSASSYLFTGIKQDVCEGDDSKDELDAMAETQLWIHAELQHHLHKLGVPLICLQELVSPGPLVQLIAVLFECWIDFCEVGIDVKDHSAVFQTFAETVKQLFSFDLILLVKNSEELFRLIGSLFQSSIQLEDLIYLLLRDKLGNFLILILREALAQAGIFEYCLECLFSVDNYCLSCDRCIFYLVHGGRRF